MCAINRSSIFRYSWLVEQLHCVWLLLLEIWRTGYAVMRWLLSRGRKQCPEALDQLQHLNKRQPTETRNKPSGSFGRTTFNFLFLLYILWGCLTNIFEECRRWCSQWLLLRSHCRGSDAHVTWRATDAPGADASPEHEDCWFSSCVRLSNNATHASRSIIEDESIIKLKCWYTRQFLDR